MASAHNIDIVASALYPGPQKIFLAIPQYFKHPVLQWTWLLGPGWQSSRLFCGENPATSTHAISLFGKHGALGTRERSSRRGWGTQSGEEEVQLPVLQLVWGVSSWHLHHRRDRRTPEPIPSGPLPTAPVCRIPSVSWALLRRQQAKELAPCMGVAGSSKPRNKMVAG